MQLGDHGRRRRILIVHGRRSWVVVARKQRRIGLDVVSCDAVPCLWYPIHFILRPWQQIGVLVTMAVDDDILIV